MSTICLTMIVKDEAPVIARCLASVRSHISRWAIVDTGSTDGTQAIVRRELAGLPGSLIERPWVDFSSNRNQSLDLARTFGGDYLLMIDADDTLVCPTPLRHLVPRGHADLLTVEERHVGSDFAQQRPLLLRQERTWRFEGAVLETIVGGPKPRRLATIDGCHVLRDGAVDEGDRAVVRARKQRYYVELLGRLHRERPSDDAIAAKLARVRHSLSSRPGFTATPRAESSPVAIGAPL
jgi:glycosyltransferase involved in cell wall biosynthesis